MKKPPIKQLQQVQFFEFWHTVATELGNSKLRINRGARTIHDFVDKESDVRDYLKDAIKKSYKLSRCRNLSSPISMDSVLDILGETAFRLQDDQRDDLFDIELLEEIAWHISNRYLACLALDKGDPSREKSGAGKSQPAQIISFPNYKIRRANSRL
ncbi:MAG: hypothetical protein HKN85_04795 [Gammaproteobacteria bacterium]|nr:hypothetical protein [Gammaproteobacteria bacterium]